MDASSENGSYGAPIYASIDDDPSYDQYKSQVAPYLRGWEAVLGHQHRQAEVVYEASVDAFANVAVVEKRMQGRDHPVLLGVPETYYLKCFILRKL